MSPSASGSSAPPSMLQTGSGPQASAATKPVRTTADHSLSCAECRRLKLKCNRQWPCETCVKRNIAHLCPDDTQKKEKKQAGSSRSADADGTAVWDKLGELERKIDLLVSAQLSSHPQRLKNDSISNLSMPSGNGLLHDLADLAADQRYRSRPRRPSESNSNSSNSKMTATSKSNAQGTLTMGPDGRALYHGPNAHSVYFARELEEETQEKGLGKVGTAEKNKEASPELGQAIPAGVTTRPGSPFNPVTSPGAAALPLPLSASTPRSDGLNDSSALMWTTPGLRSPHSSAAIYAHLRQYLPTRDAAWRMFQVCDACVTFMWDPIPFHDSIDHIFGAVYQDKGPVEKPPHPHVLSLVFSTMALGILFDVRRQLNDPLGKQMYVCAWSALCMSNFTEGLGLDGMAALSRCIVYLTGRRGGKYAESAYPLHGTLMRLTISSGMHRDPAAWDVPVTTYMAGRSREEAKEAERERRRRLFWDLQCMDVLRSLSLHRPPSLLDRYVDTLFPAEWSLNNLSEQKHQSKGLFHAFKCIQTRIYDRMLDECLCTNNATNYEATMKLDEEIKHLIRLVPPYMQPALDEVEPSADPYSALEKAYTDKDARDNLILEMQRYTNLVNIHQGLILLHRTWFSRALQKDAEDSAVEQANQQPFPGTNDEEICDVGPFAHSVRTVLASSSETILLIRALWSRQPALTNRWFFYWNLCFSAAVCCALYVIRAPKSKAAQGALSDAIGGQRHVEDQAGSDDDFASVRLQRQQQSDGRQKRVALEDGGDEEEEDDGMELIGQERRPTKKKKVGGADQRPGASGSTATASNGDSPDLFSNSNDSFATGYLAAAAAAAVGAPSQSMSNFGMDVTMSSRNGDPFPLALAPLRQPAQPFTDPDAPPSSSYPQTSYPLTDNTALGNSASASGGTEASLWIQLLSSGIEWGDDLSNIDSLFSS
ncbi:hypothetical protein L7F22_006411 [Adiantum nelumboides]|nr:hypothetical protein [Adiantum nelumboides]